MSKPVISKDNNSNINIENTNLIVTNIISAASYEGDGGLLSNLNLQSVTTSGNTTSNTIQFTNTETSLTADGNITVSGNVTASIFLGDGGALSNLATVATSGAYSDLTGVPSSITDLDVTDGTSGQFLTTDGAGTFTFATVSGSGSSNLQDVSDNGNVTSNTLIFSGGFVAGNAATSLTISSGTLTVDMSGVSYKTFTCSAGADITTLNISNDIMGSQGMIFVTATADITIYGITSTLGGTNVSASHSDISVSSGNNAIIFFASDGTNRYVNAGKYPGEAVSAGGGGSTSSNLQDISDNGNVTSNTLILSGGFVTSNAATDISVIGETMTIDMGGKSYQTFTCSTSNNISNISISGDVLGSQGMVYITAEGSITLNGVTSGLEGSNVLASHGDISLDTSENAIMFFTSDGTNRYVNAGKYPGEAASVGGTSNLEQVVNTGNVTSNTITVGGLTATANVDAGNSYVSGTVTAGYFVGDGSGLTNIPSSVSSKEYATFHPTGAQSTSTTNSWTNIILNSTRKNSNTSVFSLNTSTGEVTINKTGTYMVSFTISTGISSSTSNRSISRGGIAVNGSTDTQAFVYMYNRMNGPEHNTGAMTIVIDFTSGDVVLLRFLRQTGTDTIESIAQGISLTFLEL